MAVTIRTAGSGGGPSYVKPGGLMIPSPAFYITSGEASLQLNAAADWAAVRIISPVDFKLTSLSLRFAAEAVQGDCTAALYSDSLGSPNASLQALGTINSGGAGAAWVRLAISSGNQYQLQRAIPYWLVFKGEAAKDFSLSYRRVTTIQGSMFPKTLTSAKYSTDSGVGWTALTQDSVDAMINVVLNSTTHHCPTLIYGRFNGDGVYVT